MKYCIMLFGAMLMPFSVYADAIILPVPPASELITYNCGGVTVSSFAYELDVASGLVRGTVLAQTRCSGSGRGHSTVVHQTRHYIDWSLDGTIVDVRDCDAECPAPDWQFEASDGGYTVYNLNVPNYTTLFKKYVTVLETDDGSCETCPAPQ